eukprot:scaffold50109_cov27-Prasinocladus_malaysianus.AAC.4
MLGADIVNIIQLHDMLYQWQLIVTSPAVGCPTESSISSRQVSEHIVGFRDDNIPHDCLTD